METKTWVVILNIIPYEISFFNGKRRLSYWHMPIPIIPWSFILQMFLPIRFIDKLQFVDMSVASLLTYSFSVDAKQIRLTSPPETKISAIPQRTIACKFVESIHIIEFLSHIDLCCLLIISHYCVMGMASSQMGPMVLLEEKCIIYPTHIGVKKPINLIHWRWFGVPQRLGGNCKCMILQHILMSLFIRVKNNFKKLIVIAITKVLPGNICLPTHSSTRISKPRAHIYEDVAVLVNYAWILINCTDAFHHVCICRPSKCWSRR